MKLYLTLILTFCFYLGVNAQRISDSLISIGTKNYLYSDILRQKRTYLVYLPSDYSNKKYLPARYPVIYLLDGDYNFHSFTGLCQFLSDGPYALMPKAIVVGIANTNRTLDLTPTKSSLTDYYDNNKQLYTDSGGNENFIGFLQKELMPEIEKKYRTTGYNVLVGHSFGGLTAVNILLNHTTLFHAYLCIDPSLWWDDEVMSRRAERVFAGKDFQKRAAFISQAHKAVTPEDTTTDMARSAGRFHELLQKSKPHGLRWKWRYYENEDHGTVPVPSEWEGMKFLFEGYQIPVKQVLNDPEKLVRYYTALSVNLGFNFQPPESLLDMLGEYASNVSKPDKALRFYQIALDFYPDSQAAAKAIRKLKK